MFILPAHAAPFAVAASLDAAAQRARWTLPLTLLATLLILALVRAVTVTALFYGRRAPALPLAVLEKGGALKPTAAPTVVPGPTTGRRWLPFLGSSAPTPATTPASMAQLTAAPSPLSQAQAQPTGRGRPAARAGAVRRPEPALSVRARVEVPLPALYECQTPASMAKMIMSRHERPFSFSFHPTLPAYLRSFSAYFSVRPSWTCVHPPDRCAWTLAVSRGEWRRARLCMGVGVGVDRRSVGERAPYPRRSVGNGSPVSFQRRARRSYTVTHCRMCIDAQRSVGVGDLAFPLFPFHSTFSSVLPFVRSGGVGVDFHSVSCVPRSRSRRRPRAPSASRTHRMRMVPRIHRPSTILIFLI